MDFKLIWTEPAINDLEEIVAFLAAQQGMAKARVLGFGVFNKVEILASFPEIGSALIEKDDLCWRKLIFKTWKIAYKIDWKFHIIYIARIWHASRKELEIG